jgi:hypothetical protein
MQFLRIASVMILMVLPNLSLHEATGAMQRGGQDGEQINRILRRWERVRIDPERTVRQVRETGEFLIATSEQTFDISLEPYDIRAAEYWAEEELAGGEKRALPRATARTFRGTVSRLDDSEARFSVRERSLEGVILTPDEWYYIEPLRNFAPSADASEMVVYRRSDIREETLGVCGTTLAHRIGEAREFVEPQILADSAGSNIAEVATEADYEYVTASGGAAEANATILDVLNQVDGIYQTQLSLSLQVVYQHAWSTSDDPYNSSAAATMLNEFRSYWNANYYSIAFDLAHMWTGKDMDGSTIGIAYLSVVCEARSYSYGISQRFNSSPGKYILTAHEIGHNFGATHTEGANPPQTDCGNTIMNSSIGTGITFCPFSQAEVAAHVTASSSCLTSGPAAPSNLGAIAVSGSQINLSWQDNSSSETGFVVDRKTGAGGSWSQIGTAAANATTYNNSGLAGSTTYYYRVYAESGAGSSAYSNEASATTLGQGTSRCDFNSDGSANVLDAQILINAVLGISGNPATSDLNRDGSTNVLDLQILINVILGLRSCPG